MLAKHGQALVPLLCLASVLGCQEMYTIVRNAAADFKLNGRHRWWVAMIF